MRRTGTQLRRSITLIVGLVGVWVAVPDVAAATGAPPLVVDHSPAAFPAQGDPAGSLTPRFNFLSVRWKSHTVTYFNTAKQFSGAVKKGASAWNASGAKIRWKAVSKGAADVIIKANPGIGSAGLATYKDGRSGLIELNPGSIRGTGPEAAARQTAVVAHEMGHIMGLDHSSKGCATMNAVLWSGCKPPKEKWQHRCRILESDDVRGAVKLFGGKAKRLGKEFCASEPAPNPVTNLKAVVDSRYDGGYVKLSWKLPKKKAPKSVKVVRGDRDGRCPKGGKGSSVGGGRTGAKDQLVKSGTYCYAVIGISDLGRESKAATVKATFDGSAPFADFSWSQDDPYVVTFYDYSSDLDGDLVSWEWNFGDGSPVSGLRDPSHTFPASGTYTVTLTVRDSQGRSATSSQQVEVYEF